MSAVVGRAPVLHLVMLSEVETSFSSRARRTQHAVSLRWRGLTRTPSATALLVPLCERGTVFLRAVFGRADRLSHCKSPLSSHTRSYAHSAPKRTHQLAGVAGLFVHSTNSLHAPKQPYRAFWRAFHVCIFYLKFINTALNAA